MKSVHSQVLAPILALSFFAATTLSASAQAASINRRGGSAQQQPRFQQPTQQQPRFEQPTQQRPRFQQPTQQQPRFQQPAQQRPRRQAFDRPRIIDGGQRFPNHVGRENFGRRNGFPDRGGVFYRGRPGYPYNSPNVYYPPVIIQPDVYTNVRPRFPDQQDEFINIFRFSVPGDHLMTVNPNEGAQAAYQPEGVAFAVFAGQVEEPQNRAALFRCATANSNHFLSRDANCEGQIPEGALGFTDLNPSEFAGREILRCTNGVDHLATLDVNECANVGYRIEGSLGFVP